MDKVIQELERKANTGDKNAVHELYRMRERAGLRKIVNPPARWCNKGSDTYFFQAFGYAVYGVVRLEKPDKPKKDLALKGWLWEARVMNSARIDGKSIKGFCQTLLGAKRIVEVLLAETSTCLPEMDEDESN